MLMVTQLFIAYFIVAIYNDRKTKADSNIIQSYLPETTC